MYFFLKLFLVDFLENFYFIEDCTYNIVTQALLVKLYAFFSCSVIRRNFFLSNLFQNKLFLYCLLWQLYSLIKSTNVCGSVYFLISLSRRILSGITLVFLLFYHLDTVSLLYFGKVNGSQKTFWNLKNRMEKKGRDFNNA